MKTIVLEQPGHFAVKETAEPAGPASEEALVRVHRVGICGTDLHAYRNQHPFLSYPRILGHELGVEVVAMGAEVDHVAVGDRCAVEPYMNCGHCIACRRDRPNCCERLEVLGVHIDGGMRTHMTVPAKKLHRSRRLSFDQLALVETLCIGAHAVERTAIEKDEAVLVIGAGPIGLGTIQFALARGSRVVVMDLSESRLNFCREQVGVRNTLLPSERSMDEIRRVLGGDLPTAVFDATGNGESMCRAFDFVAAGGRLTFVGLFRGEVTFHDPELHRRELTILASRNGTPTDFKHVIATLESGAIDLAPWITHRADVDTMIEAYDQWLDPGNGVVKAMVSF